MPENEVDLPWELLKTQRELDRVRVRADRFMEDHLKLYELRGWLRILDDDPAGHQEFFRHACFLIFGEYNGITIDEAYRDDGTWIFDDE